MKSLLNGHMAAYELVEANKVQPSVYGHMAELVDALVSGTSGSNTLEVRVFLCPPNLKIGILVPDFFLSGFLFYNTAFFIFVCDRHCCQKEHCGFFLFSALFCCLFFCGLVFLL